MKQSDIQGLTPTQIADKYALPNVPTHITSVKPPEGTKIRTGTANSNFGGVGNAQQFEFIDGTPTEGWRNGTPLR